MPRSAHNRDQSGKGEVGWWVATEGTEQVLAEIEYPQLDCLSTESPYQDNCDRRTDPADRGQAVLGACDTPDSVSTSANRRHAASRLTFDVDPHLVSLPVIMLIVVGTPILCVVDLATTPKVAFQDSPMARAILDAADRSC